MVLVMGHEADKLKTLVSDMPNVSLALNPDYKRGRSGSVVAGVKALDSETSAVVILGVDQPRPSDILDQVIQAHLDGGKTITIPTYQGERGHPAVFDASLIKELKGLTEDTQGLRQVVYKDTDRVQEVPVFSSVALLDLNRPEDYQRGLDMFKALGYQ